MPISKRTKKLAAVIACLLFVIVCIAACGKDDDPDLNDPLLTSSDAADTPEPADTPPEETARPPEPSDTSSSAPPSPSPSAPELVLVPYDGVVEHLFFHEVIAYPELAFNGNAMEKGYDDNMVTVSEYNKMLESMYANGYILVDMNDVWSEYSNDDWQRRMKKNTLMLPEGKKPLILSFDDISFYEYMRGDGFMEKLIIGEDGDIWATGYDPAGNLVVSQDYTVVTILDKFIKEHPDFSLGGVKGCIALTGYEGILGYRTQYDKNDDSNEFRLNRMKEIALVRPVIQRLKETGWYFATHSYGHINLHNASLNGVMNDAQRWLDEVGSLVGETKLFIYPFGSRLDGDDVNKTGPAFKYYQELGFRIFASVGIEPYVKIKSDIAAVICDRMHADGITLRKSRDSYMKFYDAKEVFDPMRKDKYGKSW